MSSPDNEAIIVEDIFSFFDKNGENAYFGEKVSQKEHALQTAAIAAREGADDALITAALLHDIGHLLHSGGEDIAEQGIDAKHEEAGESFLKRYFGTEVTQPVQLHVSAKRYLCAVEPDYLASLSPASLQSLHLQGGPFTEHEVALFESNQFFKDAVRLRRWDDEAKIPGLIVPELEAYRSSIERSIQRKVSKR